MIFVWEDHEVPALHSILRVTRRSASITLMAERPELFVNGESVPRAVLLDGDIVEIADVRLVFRFVTENTVSDSAELMHFGINEENAEPESDPIQEMTASELVTGLEHEFQLLDELHTSSADTMDRLLNAARRSNDGVSIKLAAPPLRVVGIEEGFLAADREQLQEITAKVRQQESRLSDVCHVLEKIVSQQQIMTTALQSVADRLTELRNALPVDSSTTRRASA